MDNKEVYGLIARYFILILIAFPNLYFFYSLFTPLTVYPLFWILNLLFGASLLPDSIIVFKGFSAQIIPACVAGAAYYLLVVLNLSTPMDLKKRVYSLLFLVITFLILNLARLVLFAILLQSGFQYFDLAHELVWYFGSTILLVIVWFANVYIFKIKEIPVYSDLRNIFKDIKKK